MHNFLQAIVKMVCILFFLWSGSGQTQTVFRVGLWGQEDDERARGLQSALERVLLEEGLISGFDTIRIETTLDPAQRAAQLMDGRYLLVECDPALYMTTKRSRTELEPERWLYEVIFQGMKTRHPPGGNRGVIAVRDESEIRHLSDLRGRILGLIHPDLLTSGLVQLEYLRQFGLEEGRHLHIVRAESVEALAAAFFSDLVDAVAIPEDRLAAFIQANEQTLTVSGREGRDRVRYLFRSEALPGPLWAVHRRLVRTRADLVARLRSHLPSAWSGDILVPSQDEYYLTTMGWLRSR